MSSLASQIGFPLFSTSKWAKASKFSDIFFPRLEISFPLSNPEIFKVARLTDPSPWNYSVII